MRPCPGCSASVVDEARFCPFCGRPLAPPSSPSATSLPATPRSGAPQARAAAPSAAAAPPAPAPRPQMILATPTSVTPMGQPEEEEAPQTVADPFTHTAPADPAELARLSALIAASARSGGAVGVPVRERVLGSTSPLAAVVDRRDPVPGLARTLESEVVADARAAPTPEPSLNDTARSATPEPVPPAAGSAPRADASVVSPRAATKSEAPALGVGSSVRVLWSDGQAYPATITQMAPTHALVQFPNGYSQWVEVRYLVPPQ